MKEYKPLFELKESDLNRVIEMAWEDRTPFEAIKFQFGLLENDVKLVMKTTLKPSSYILWRKRVQKGVSQKHKFKRSEDITRFKCNQQRTITSNKISKR